MASPDADVLIVGSGPVGLCLALELGLRGNRVMVIERDSSRGPQPRAKTLNLRSLSLFRRWGIADDIRRASPTGDLPTDIVFQTRLFGHHIATLPNIYFRGNLCQDDERFPEPSEWIPQYLVERVLKERLDLLDNVTFCFDTELLDFAQRGGRVEARLRAGSRDISVSATFLVGADGARSRVREAIGAKLEGRHAFASHYNLVLRIPQLKAEPPTPRGIMHWIINADAPSVMSPMGEYWTLGTQLPEGADELSIKEIGALVTATTGRSLDFEVVNVDRWFAHQLIATSYREGNVFLAGDACHLHPPFGGYGMNMGIADAVDLGWKLDAVLKGWGGASLLDSYEWERRRVHQWTIDEAVENYRYLTRDMIVPGLELDDEEGPRIRAALGERILEVKRREFHTIGLLLGAHYSGSGIVVGDHLPDQPPLPMDYVPQPVAGGLAPHFWLADGRSLYDCFGSGFTLLDIGGDAQSRADIVGAADAAGVPLSLVEPHEARAVELYGNGLFLVRPDQYIAWSGDLLSPDEAKGVLDRVTGRAVPE